MVTASTATTSTVIARTDVATSLAYEELVRRFEDTLRMWDQQTGEKLVARRAPWADVEAAAAETGGALGLMILARIDQGVLTSLSGQSKRCRLYLVGNPAIASRILDVDPHAALYVPFRIAIYEDERAGGAWLSFDRPSASLAALGKAELAAFGSLLDGKVEALVRAICGDRLAA